MADKDEVNGVGPTATPGEPEIKNDIKSGQDGNTGLEADGLALSADPEFLALAADFDAAIKGGELDNKAEASETVQPPEPDFVLAPEPAVSAGQTEPVEPGRPEDEPVTPAKADEAPLSAGELAEEPAQKRGFFRRSRPKRRAGDKAAPVQKFPRLDVVSAADPTLLSRLFNCLALGGIFVLTALFLLQVLPGLQTSRLLWFSDELRQADVLAGVFNGNWLQIQLNGQLYQGSPPLYFWFLAGLHKLLALAGLDLGTDYARLLYIGAAVSGLLLLWATCGLARFTAHLDRRGVFAAGCVFLSVLFLQFFFHYSSLDLFFAAFIVASHIFMFKALTRPHAPLFIGLAFLCAAAALMTKGVLGIALPVLSAVLFSLWQGKPGRPLKGDFLLGLVLALLPAVIWLGAIWAGGQHDVVVEMLKQQVWVKVFGGSAPGEPWWYYLAVLPALWVPWSFLVLALPWHKLFSQPFREAVKSARTGERQGLAFVWIFFLGSFALISLVQHKQPVYLLPLMGPLAVLTGRAVLQLSPLRSMILQRVMAVFFFLLAVAFVLLPVYYSGNIPSFFSFLEKIALPPWEVKVNGIFLLAVIMLGTTCILLGLVKARRPESTFLALLLSATLFSYPMSTMTMPSLDGVVSSRAASIEIRRYADLGYYPMSFKVHPGVFSYYSGIVLHETDDWSELERMVAVQPKVVVAISARRWEDWTKNPGFTEVMRFWMLSVEYVLLLRNVTPDLPEIFDEPQEPESYGPLFEMPMDEELGLPLEEPAREEPGETAPDASGESGESDLEVRSPEPAGSPGEPLDKPADEPVDESWDESVPDGLPLTDEPAPYDPFSPVPEE